MPLEWHGEGDDEVAVSDGRVIVRIDPQYKRPAEVDTLLGDADKARLLLGWSPSITFNEMVREMVAFDMANAKRESSR